MIAVPEKKVIVIAAAAAVWIAEIALYGFGVFSNRFYFSDWLLLDDWMNLQEPLGVYKMRTATQTL